MTQKFKLPDLGEGVHEGEILEIPVSVGDEVAEDDVILTVETDKAAVDIPSPYAGTVQEIHVEKGEIVHVGDVMLTFGNGGGTTEAEQEETEEEDSDEKKAQREQKREEQESEEEQKQGEKERQPQQREKAEQPEQGERGGNGRQGKQEREPGHPVPAAPATRRLAREEGVDLRQVEGSGPGGRVTREDVRSYAEGGAPQREAEERTPEKGKEEKRERQPLAMPQAGAAPELPDFSKWGEVEHQPLRSVRRVTAQRMAQSWSQIPHVNHHDRADITELENMRQQLSDESGLKNLTLLTFVMKAVVASLKKYPRFNASLDSEAGEIIVKHYYNIGLAVDTERGLIVPVIRDVESKSLAELAEEMETLVKRTRAGETGLEEMQGGTFTITNVGPLGGTHFDPIINYPQAAILGIAHVDWQPVVQEKDGQRKIEPRLMMPLVLAFDHRLVDGAEAARFMNDMVRMLEEPDRFMLRL